MIISVPKRNRKKSSTIAGSPKKRHLNTATATSFVKEEYMMDVSNTMESSHVSPDDVAAQEPLLQAMKTVCCVYTKDFQNPHKTNDLQGRDDQGEGIELVQCDHSYNVRRQ